MPYRNKVYVSFDGDKDISYYYLMRAWKQSDRTAFDFYDAHDLNSARDTSTEDSIKAQLRIRFQNAKTFVLLVGESTQYLFKFVRWEIEQALARDLPIIVVNLNGLRSMDELRCPPILRDKLSIHVSFNASVLQYALENWPETHRIRKLRRETTTYYYTNTVYSQLGL